MEIKELKGKTIIEVVDTGCSLVLHLSNGVKVELYPSIYGDVRVKKRED